MCDAVSVYGLVTAQIIDRLGNRDGVRFERKCNPRWLKSLVQRGLLRRIDGALDGRVHDITDKGREFADRILQRTP
jgi:hypothetical protein